MPGGERRNRQHAAHRLHTAIQRQRTDDDQLGEPVRRQNTDGREQTERNR